MLYHPHVHMLVTAGGLSADGLCWVEPKNPKFLVPVRTLSVIFRAKMGAALKKAGLLGGVVSDVWNKPWVVHCQHAGSGERVLHYLGRYVFRIALTNNRLERIQDGPTTGRRRFNTAPSPASTFFSASSSTCFPGAAPRFATTASSVRTVIPNSSRRASCFLGGPNFQPTIRATPCRQQRLRQCVPTAVSENSSLLKPFNASAHHDHDRLTHDRSMSRSASVTCERLPIRLSCPISNRSSQPACCRDLVSERPQKHVWPTSHCLLRPTLKMNP